MARIEQPFSARSIMTGPVTGEAPLSAFTNDGAASLARGLQDLSTGIVLNRKISAQIAEKQKQKEDDLWLNKALSDYTRSLTDFEVHPENQRRVDLLPSYLEKVDNDAQAVLESAPSPEASAAFEEKARSIVDSRYSRVAAQAATNELTSELEIITNSWGQSLSSYHQMAATDPEGAAADLFNNLSFSSESIMALYGDVQPELARKMVAKNIEEAAMALSDKNPEQAKKIVIDNPFLDEQSRQQLLNRLEVKQKEVSLVLKEDFSTAREKTVIAAQKYGTPGEIPLADYQTVFPGEEGIVLKRRDDSKISAAVKSHEFLASVKGKLPGAKQAEAEKLQQSLDTEDKLQAFGSIVQPALTRDQTLYEKDSVQWLMENNDTVQSIQRELTELEAAASDEVGVGVDGQGGVLPPMAGQEPDPALTAGTREQLYNTLLKYQGYPIEGGDPTHFMGKPPGERRLLTKSQAQSLADQINSGTIDSAVSTINGILEQYPTDELRSQVITDLTTMPVSKIKPEFQIAFQNAGQPWLPDFIGALKSVGDLSSMGAVDSAKVKAAVATNGTWNAFRNSIMGPQNQRSAELGGYFDAIEVYAKTKMVKGGLTPTKAVDAAIEQILTSTMAPVEVTRPALNRMSMRTESSFSKTNQQLWIPNTLYGNRLDEKELADLGRRMGVALAHIHPDDLDPNQFPVYSQIADQQERRKLIYKQIVETGSYYPDPGGTTFRVTIKKPGEGGERVDLRTKDGKLFQLPIDKLPSYTTMVGNKKKGTNFPIEAVDKDGYPTTGHFWNFTR